MKIIKHFANVLVWKIKGISCKHENIGVASCPYTMLTYSTCENCRKRIKVEKTNG